jgi:hypothetical protein
MAKETMQSILALHGLVAVWRLLEKICGKYDTTEGHMIPGAFHKQLTAAYNALGSNLGVKHSAAMTEVGRCERSDEHEAVVSECKMVMIPIRNDMRLSAVFENVGKMMTCDLEGQTVA